MAVNYATRSKENEPLHRDYARPLKGIAPHRVALFCFLLLSSYSNDLAMAIGSAIQKGTSVSIFDENGKPLAIIHCGNGPEDGLVGYTSTTITLRRGSTLQICDEKGRVKNTRAI